MISRTTLYNHEPSWTSLDLILKLCLKLGWHKSEILKMTAADYRGAHWSRLEQRRQDCSKMGTQDRWHCRLTVDTGHWPRTRRAAPSCLIQAVTVHFFLFSSSWSSEFIELFTRTPSLLQPAPATLSWRLDLQSPDQTISDFHHHHLTVLLCHYMSFENTEPSPSPIT